MAYYRVAACVHEISVALDQLKDRLRANIGNFTRDRVETEWLSDVTQGEVDYTDLNFGALLAEIDAFHKEFLEKNQTLVGDE